MSLLMDALKKAEQEKREAARRLKESEAPSIQENDDNQEQEAGGTSAGDNTGEHPSAEAPRQPRPSTTLELSLAPIEEAPEQKKSSPTLETRFSEDLKIREDDGDATLEDEDLQLNIDAASALAEEEPDRERAEQEETDSSQIEEMEREQSTAEPEATFHGIDLDETMETAMFEDTVEGDVGRRSEGAGAYDETLPAVSAAQMAEDIGSEDQPTPVAAQTVFTAGMTRNEKSPAFKWLLVSAAMILLIAAGVWYYYTVTPISRELPSPMVARGIESAAPPERATPAVPKVVQSGSLGTSGEAPVEKAAGSAVAEPTAAAPASTSAGSAGGAAAEPPEAATEPEPAPSAAVVETESAGAATPAAAGPAETAGPDAGAGEAAANQAAQRDTRAAVLPQAIEPPPSLIKISRSKAPPPEAALLKQAYHAYRNGDYAAARETYGQVLERRPDNRDALLGLAAVALQQEQPQRALTVYARLLELNPRDNLARAALISMSRNTDTVRSESAIKLMLREKPEQAYLHFALGNVYAAQSRWSDAQQAFFDAYRLESGNADYALNLAVSLDHLGKPDTALDYYRTALDLAGDGGSNFDDAALMKRIETLQGVRQP